MATRKKKILIVEDEAVVRESVRDWLEEDGYEVECVESGEEALDKMKEEKFGVVVLDIRLPGMDGWQVYDQVREVAPETKGVITTAYPSQETLDKAKKLGLLDYLPKPFKVEDLEKIVSGALGELEEKKIGTKHVWLELGAVSYRLCDREYKCGSCAFAQDIQDRFGTIAVIGEDEIAKLMKLPGSQRLCRYASVHFVPKEKEGLS